MSYLMEALRSTPTSSGEIPIPSDVEMRAAAKPTLVPKAEDKELQEDAEMEDLFGNDEDLEAKEENDRMTLQGSGIAGTPTSSRSEERQLRERLEYEEPEEPGDVIHEITEANVSIPNLPVPISSDGDHWVIRMPNFVKVDSKPFHPDTYMGPEHDDDELQQGENLRERSMTIKLKVENTVRWRWAKDEFGQDIRQSNSRVIRWSDGTLSLRLGKELFDINQSIDTSGGAPRGLFGGSQASQSQSPSVPPASQQISGTKSQGLTYLVAQHKRAQLLQAEAVITGYMTLRPTGMQSETHRMLVRAVGQKHNKVARLRMAPDPKMDPAREVAELLKVAAKKSKKRPEEDEFGGRKRRSGHSRKRTADVWSDDDDEPEDMGSEDEDDDLTGGLRKAKTKIDEEAKKRRWDYEEDDFVVADSSDEGSEGGNKTKKRQRAVDDDVEDDPLDQMEAKLKEQDREGRKKRQRKTSETKDVDVSEAPYNVGDEDDGDEEMDVESEEMEEEIKVRRAGVGPRRKRAIDFEEEEEEE